MDMSAEVSNVVCLLREMIAKSRMRVTASYLVGVMRGSRNRAVQELGGMNHTSHGLLKRWSKENVQRLLHKLDMDDILDLNLIKNSKVNTTPTWH